jgi:hypothetical protein
METLNKCISSRDNRKKLYSEWKGYFLSGSAPNATGAVMNKIYSHIEQLCALVYSSETTRFSVDLTPSASDLEKSKVPALMTAINEEWHNSNADLTFTMALMWSFVYGSMFVKLRISGTEIESAVVHPADVGVLREDVHGLWRQEAFCHAYFISKSQFEYEMKQIPHPRLDKIMSQIIAKPRPAEASTTAGVDRLVTSSSDPQVIGNVNFDLSGSNKYRPDVSEDLLQMYELYVFDDEEKDFRIVTIADPGITIFDRPIRDLFIEKEIPLIQICPNPSHEYFWGYSETEKLIPLQKMRNTRMDQINHLLNLQANPPKWGTGFSNDMAEMLSALDTPSGGVFSDMPGGKIEQLTPKIPDDLFKEIREIDQMFEEMSGITNVIQGKGEQGVRAGSHAGTLMKTASPTLRDRALIAERNCAVAADLTMEIKEAKDDSDYWTKADTIQDVRETQFKLMDLPDDWRVEVDSHSSSPIFSDENAQLILAAHAKGIVQTEYVIQNMPFPNREDALAQNRDAAKEKQAMIKQLMAENPEAAEKVLAKTLGGGKR